MPYMIHLALMIAAFLFLCWVGLMALGIVGKAFEVHPACGCFTLVLVASAVLVLVLL